MATQKSWDEYAYKVFVSYSQRDKDWGEWLEQSLEAYRVPKDLVGKWTPFGPIPQRIRPVFRDRTGLAAEHSIGTAIQSRLDDSAILIVLCSPNSASSRYVNDEIIHFKTSGRSDRIFSIIVEGEPNSSDASRECFPPALKFRVGVNGDVLTTPDQPIAADARQEGDGRETAFLKIVAGVLNVDLTDLKEKTNEILARDAKRARLVRNIMSAIAICAIGFGGVGLQQRQYALEQQSNYVFSEARRLLNDGYDREARALALEVLPTAKGAILPRPLNREAFLATWGSLQTDRLVSVFRGHTEDIQSIDYSPDGKLIATASSDGSVRIWDAATGALRNTFLGHNEAVYSARFSPSGNEIFSVGRDNFGRLWRVADGNEIRAPLSSDKTMVASFSWSPNGDKIAILTRNNEVILWDVVTWRKIREAELTGDNAENDSFRAGSIEFSRNGAELVVTTGEKCAFIYDAATMVKTAMQCVDSEFEILDRASFSADARTVILSDSRSFSDDSYIWRRDIGTIAYFPEITEKENFHSMSKLTELAFDASGERIVGHLDYGRAVVLDAVAGNMIFAVPSYTFSAPTLSPDGKFLAASCHKEFENSLCIWDAATKAKVYFPPEFQRYSRIKAIYSGEADQAYIFDDTNAFVWRKDTLLPVFAADETEVILEIRETEQKTIVLLYNKDSFGLRMVQAQSGLEISRFEGHVADVTGVGFSADGNRLVTASADATASVWDTISGKEIARIDASGETPLASTAISPNGELVLTSAKNGDLSLWRVAESPILIRTTNLGREYNLLKFSPDGRNFVVAPYFNFSHNGKSVKVWDTNLWRERFEINCEYCDWRELEFSPDGRFIAALRDSAVTFWDMKSGREYMRWDPAGDETSLGLSANSVDFKDDGKEFVVAFGDGSVRRVKLSTPAQSSTIEEACERTSRIGLAKASKTVLRNVNLPLDRPAPCERYGLLHWGFYGRAVVELREVAKIWWAERVQSPSAASGAASPT